MELIVRNGQVITPIKHIPLGGVRISQGQIAEVFEGDSLSDSNQTPVLDAQGGYIVPGLIDIHIHGSGGFAVMAGRAETFLSLSSYLARTGTTSWVATTMTASHEDLHEVAQAFTQFMAWPRQEGATLLGLHLEGPYISLAKKGAQDPRYIRKFDYSELLELQELTHGGIKRITLAPEELADQNDLTLIRNLGIIPSLGHSSADYAQVQEATKHGLNLVTHLYNGMEGLHHHHPGTAAAALDLKELTVELIADGVHVHPAMLRLAVRAKGVDRAVLITDALPAAGLPNGRYPEFGVEVRDDAIYLLNGILSGSKLSLAQAVRYMVHEVGISVIEAIHMASLTPAQIMGVASTKGSLETGKDADIVVLDPDFTPRVTLIEGQVVYQN